MAKKNKNQRLLEQAIREYFTDDENEIELMELDEVEEVIVQAAGDQPNDGSHLVFVNVDEDVEQPEELFRITVQRLVLKDGNYVEETK